MTREPATNGTRSVAEARTVVSERREMKTVRDHGAVIGVKRKPRKREGKSETITAPSIVSLRPSVISALRPSSFACRVIRPEGARRARNEARRVPTSRGTAGEPDKERDGSQTDHGSEGDMIAVNLVSREPRQM